MPHRSTRAVAAMLGACLVLSGCGWFGGHKAKTTSTSVFDVKPGECFIGPKDVKSELSALTRTDCRASHTEESYAIVQYSGTAGAGSSVATASSAYPGDDVLTKFAQGSCAQQFHGYVGVDYLDSSLFFTWLLPSARGWEQDDDRKIVCFVTTTGAGLTSSVKGSKK